MKLLTRINRNFLITATVLLMVWSIIFYFSLRFIIHYQVDEDLEDERDQIIFQFEQSGKLPVSQSLAGELVAVHRVDVLPQISYELTDSIFIEELEQELVPYRLLSFGLKGNEGNYVVTLGESQFETEDLISVMLIFILLFVLVLISVLYFLNRRTSKNIWLPFNETLEKLKSFEITGQHKISFSSLSIREFDELNQSLNRMTERIYEDYNRLKQFTENASHEIQTPLSIIRSKIEILIQSENLSEEQINSIQQINESVSRLSKLNSALLTLAKIENHQFADAAEIPLAPFIRDKFKVLDEMMQQKKIILRMEADKKVHLKMNDSLADLLFDNLIGNAIKHNYENGFIGISIQPHKFSISNSGTPLQISPDKLFHRFVKNNPSSDSLGLGLAMVKQICVSCKFDIQFTSKENIHTVTISI